MPMLDRPADEGTPARRCQPRVSHSPHGLLLSHRDTVSLRVAFGRDCFRVEGKGDPHHVINTVTQNVAKMGVIMDTVYPRPAQPQSLHALRATISGPAIRASLLSIK
jgi:hypothetical protein